MTGADTRDYKSTVFLPKTDFPIRAGLPKKEPELLERYLAGMVNSLPAISCIWPPFHSTRTHSSPVTFSPSPSTRLASTAQSAARAPRRDASLTASLLDHRPYSALDDLVAPL